MVGPKYGGDDVAGDADAQVAWLLRWHGHGGGVVRVMRGAG